uniref:AMP-dependent synthetase/ligase domain-containing protein n=1 Tax=Branchiostoma floridae TaxID=7739 RepID=C3Y4Z5_BRAFL|eukprot:XP_002608518.1 hypothetical protein BRAFLDRAFT_92400 [Branchiostoma floridae]
MAFGWRSAESAGVRLLHPNVLKCSKHSALNGNSGMGRLVVGWCSARSASVRLVFGNLRVYFFTANTMSYMRGATDDPLLDVTFGQLLDDTAARWPDREAYVFKKTGSRVTFADIQEKATRLAAGLKAIGTARGDVVAWLFGHRPEWIYLYFAVAKLGAIAFPLQEERVGRSVETMNYFLNKVMMIVCRWRILY